MTDRAHELSRRDFLRLGLAAGPASLVAACGWDGGALLEPKLRAFSRLNDWVGEKILLSPIPPRAASIRPASERAEGRFPAYSITWNRRRFYPDSTGGLGARGGRPGPRRRRGSPWTMLEALPRGDLHGEAPLRGGLDRDRHLDRRAGLG